MAYLVYIDIITYLLCFVKSDFIFCKHKKQKEPSGKTRFLKKRKVITNEQNTCRIDTIIITYNCYFVNMFSKNSIK